MTSAVIFALMTCSVFILEARGQLPGIIGSPCKSDNPCLDKNNHVCDTTATPSLCKIRAGKGCQRQPDKCVSGAVCQETCMCANGATDDGLCRKAQVVTESEPDVTTDSTTDLTTGKVTTTTTTKAPASTTTTKTSGAAQQTRTSFVGHVVTMMAVWVLRLF